MHARVALNLRERGEAQVVPRDEWARVESSGDAQELVRLGILQARRSGESVIIEPRTLVGRFLSPTAAIEIKPKRPELLAVLLRVSEKWRKLPSRLDEEQAGRTIAPSTLAQKYRILLLELCSEGTPWRYSRKVLSTASPQGRLRLQETITRLLSKGITHKVVVSKQAKEDDSTLPSALRTVLRAIEGLEVVPLQFRSDIFRLLHVLGPSNELMPEADARDCLAALSEEFSDRPALAAVIDFSLIVLASRQPFRMSSRVGNGVAEFVDMERLWEDAMAFLVHTQMASDFDIVMQHPLRSKAVTFMDDGGPKLDPDLVAFRGKSARLIVDAKYSVATTPSADDVYQIAAYLDRLKAPLGVLAYVSPGEVTTVESIGTLAGGARVVMWSVAADALDASRGSLSERLFSRLR